jgi:hypothetical protein
VGRNFTENDNAAAPGVVLINQALAKQFWPNEDPVGQHIIIGQGMGPELEEPAWEIIGVVSDTHNTGLGRPPDPMMIVPVAQVTDGYTAAYSDVQPLILGGAYPRRAYQAVAAVTEQLRLASNGKEVIYHGPGWTSHALLSDEVRTCPVCYAMFITAGSPKDQDRPHLALAECFEVTSRIGCLLRCPMIANVVSEQRTTEYLDGNANLPGHFFKGWWSKLMTRVSFHAPSLFCQS